MKASLLATLLQQFHTSSSAHHIQHSPHPSSSPTQSIDHALSHLLYLQQYLASLSAHLRALRSEPPATCPYLDLIQRIVGMVVNAPPVPNSAQYITAPTPAVLRPSSAHTAHRGSTTNGTAPAPAGDSAGLHFISGLGGGGSVRSVVRAPTGVSFVHGRWQSIDGLKEHEDDTVNELDAIDDWDDHNAKVDSTAGADMQLKAAVQPSTAAMVIGRQRKKSWSQVVQAAEVGLADVEESELDEGKLASKLQQQKREQQRPIAYVNGRWTDMEEKVEGVADGTHTAVGEDETVDELDSITDFDDDQPANTSSTISSNHSSTSLSSMSTLSASSVSSGASTPRSLQSVLDAMSEESSRLSSAAASRQHSRQSSRAARLSILQRAIATLDERKEEDEDDDDETWEGREDSTAVNVERSRIRDEDVADVANVSEEVDAGRTTRTQQLTADELDDFDAFEALDDASDNERLSPTALTQPTAATGGGRGERELREFEVDEAWLGRVREEERLYMAARHGHSVEEVHGLTWGELSEYGRQWHHERDGSELDDVLVWDEDEAGEEVKEEEEEENDEEEETDGQDEEDEMSDVDDELERRLASRQTAATSNAQGTADDEEEDWGE